MILKFLVSFRYLGCSKVSTVFNARDCNDRIRAIQTNTANDREFGISPVKTLIEEVHSQTCKGRRYGNVICALLL